MPLTASTRPPSLCLAALLVFASADANARPEIVTKMSRPTPIAEFGAYRLDRVINDWAFRGGHDRNWNSYAAALRFARCVTKFEPTAADRLLRTPIGAPDDRPELVRLVRKNRACTSDLNAVSPVLLRAALAETTLGGVSEFRTASTNQVGVPTVIDGFQLLNVARCQLRYAPGRVVQVLHTEPGGKEEKAAADDLFRNTPECGTTEGLGGIEATVARLALVAAAYPVH